MEESDGETADSVWFGYECKSGEILFYYNQKTGEHRWAKDLGCSESNVIKVSISDLSGKHPSDVHSVGTQTEDYGCTSGCSSIYIHNEDHTVTSNRDESMCPVDRPSNICGVSVDDGHHLIEQSERMIPNREDEDNVIDEEWNGGSEKPGNDKDCILTDSCPSTGLLPENPPENKAKWNEESDDKTQDLHFESLMTDSCQSTQDVSDFIKDGKRIGNGNRVFENPYRYKMTAVAVRLEDIRYNLMNILDENSASERFRICLENDCNFKKNTSESTEESTVNGSCESTVSCAAPQNVIKCLENSDYKRQETERDSEVSDSYKSTDFSSSAPGDLPTPESPQKKIKKSRNDSPVEHDKGFGSKNKDCDENGKDKDMNKKQKKSKHGRKVSIQAKNQRRVKEINENVSRETYFDKQFALKRYPQNHCHNTGVKPFKCSYCVKAFSQKSDLIRHIRTHTGEKPFKCSHCGKAFSRKSHLDLHIRTHTGEKPFKCSQCGKVFTRKSALTCHIQTHTGEKPFNCSYCGKAFSRKSILNCHIKTHTGEKLFKCSQCGKAYTQKSALICHIQTHTGEKPFNCSYCGKAFSRKSILNCHIKTHTGEKLFKCSQCGKAYTQKSTLICHIKTHTCEKPFKCSHCGKAFRYKSNLNYHIKTHTGEKPFKC